MPTYAYACKTCGHRFDVVQSFTDASLTECPECGGELRKQYGSIGVTFNGSGFYRTDSRSGEGKGGEKKSGDTKSADAGAKSPSGESGGSSTPAPSSSKSEAKASPASSGS